MYIVIKKKICFQTDITNQCNIYESKDDLVNCETLGIWNSNGLLNPNQKTSSRHCKWEENLTEGVRVSNDFRVKIYTLLEDWKEPWKIKLTSLGVTRMRTFPKSLLEIRGKNLNPPRDIINITKKYTLKEAWWRLTNN